MGGELKRPTTMRCPICDYVSCNAIEDGTDFYFRCQNFKCKVERIYGENAVMLRENKNVIIRSTSEKVREIL